MTHDANGNLTNDGRFQYDWDGYNRLWRVRTLGGATVATCAYDAENRRVRKSVSGGATAKRGLVPFRPFERSPVRALPKTQITQRSTAGFHRGHVRMRETQPKKYPRPRFPKIKEILKWLEEWVDSGKIPIKIPVADVSLEWSILNTGPRYPPGDVCECLCSKPLPFGPEDWKKAKRFSGPPITKRNKTV